MSFNRIADLVTSEATEPFREDIAGIVTKAQAERAEIMKGTFPVRVHKSDAEDEETGIGDFLDFEELMAAVMVNAWARKAKDAHTRMLEVLGVTQKTEHYQHERLESAVDAVDNEMSDLVTAADEARLLKLHKSAARRGAAIVNATDALDEMPRFDAVMENMVKSSKYYTNAYFNQQVIPKLYKAVEDYVTSQGASKPEEIYRIVRQQLDDRLLKRVPYWHTVSSGGASRAYHYGLIKGGTRLGYRGYQFVAINDSRTSAICRSLSGREFWLADAEEIYDRIANADDDDIKNANPWVTGEEAKGLTEQEVYARAAYVPPLHGRCRSTIRLLSI